MNFSKLFQQVFGLPVEEPAEYHYTVRVDPIRIIRRLGQRDISDSRETDTFSEAKDLLIGVITDEMAQTTQEYDRCYDLLKSVRRMDDGSSLYSSDPVD